MSQVSTSAPPADPGVIPGALPTRQLCTGCGLRLDPMQPVRARCPAARTGDDTDHVVVRALDPARVVWPDGDEANPFIRYRTLLHGYHVARARGLTDADVVASIDRLDAAVAAVDGSGFRVTGLHRNDELAGALGMSDRGTLLVKDETGNVSGSHKARHLFGALLEIELAGGLDADAGHPLAIASCGNAALAAAVVARAAERRLQVYIPMDADPWIVMQLERLGAAITRCARQPGESGDPTYHRLLGAMASGAIGFTCQGNLNGLAIEGGETLGWELVSQLAAADRHLDRLVIQVGGGALASSVIQALLEARELGALRSLPRIDTVQTRGAFPLARAYERSVARLGPAPSLAAIEELLSNAARHRSDYMWPWESEPHSVAEGILDDETYDWRAVLRGMLLTGGTPLIVDEATLREAHRLAVQATGIDVSHTGSAGLAGLLDLQRRGQLITDETIAVIFTGIRRSGEPS